METEKSKATVNPDLGDLREHLLGRRVVSVTVQGGCMSPSLRDGQMILVHRAREPRTGDVALLDAGGTLEIHRLLDRVRSRGRTWYVHSGDASGAACGIAGDADVLGIASAPPRGPVPLRARLVGLALRARALLHLFVG
jgi:hypothetical protein